MPELIYKSGMDNSELADIFENSTTRQHEVLHLIAHGYTTKEVASQLAIAERTVNQHVDVIRTKANDLPRKQLARHYRSWFEARDFVTRDSFTIDPPPKNHDPVSQRSSESVGELSDSLIFDQRLSWEPSPARKLSEIKPSELGRAGIFLAMLAGAVLILMIAILGLGFSEGLQALLG